MLAVSKGSTILKYGWRHYCQQHKVFVDKKHMCRCSLLEGMGQLNRFNKLIESTELRDLPKRKVVEIKVLFGWLRQRLDKLEQENKFTPL